MRTIDLGGRTFSVKPLTEAMYGLYRAFAEKQARSRDRPLERFLAKLGGVAGADREAAIRGYMSRADWDRPPPELVDECARSTDSCVWLIVNAAEPRVTVAEARELVAANPDCFARLAKALNPPTIEDQLAANEELRKRLCPSTSTATLSSSPLPTLPLSGN